MKLALMRAMHFGARSILRRPTASGLSQRDVEIISRVKEAGRAQSHDDFIHKLAICEKEAAETEYWLELLLESRHAKETAIESLLAESRELLAIFVASGKTAKSRR